MSSKYASSHPGQLCELFSYLLESEPLDDISLGATFPVSQPPMYRHIGGKSSSTVDFQITRPTSGFFLPASLLNPENRHNCNGEPPYHITLVVSFPFS